MNRIKVAIIGVLMLRALVSMAEQDEIDFDGLLALGPIVSEAPIGDVPAGNAALVPPAAPVPVTEISTDGTTLFGGARIANIFSLIQHPGKWTWGEYTAGGGILAALVGIGSQTDWYGLAGGGGDGEPPKTGASGSASISPSGTTKLDFSDVTGGVALTQGKSSSGSSTTTITITQAP